jgi:hypothetical protein
MKILTCITNPSHVGYVSLLRRSCARRELDLVTLFYRGDWLSYRIRDELLRLYVARLPADDILMVTDGYDTMLLSSANEIEETFTEMGYPLVFATTDACRPLPALSSSYPGAIAPPRYLASAGFIGRAGAMSELLNRYEGRSAAITSAHGGDSNSANERDDRREKAALDTDLRWSSQYFWHTLFLANQTSVCLDRDGKLFGSVDTCLKRPSNCSMSDVLEEDDSVEAMLDEQCRAFQDEWDIVDSRLVNRRDGTTPCHLHFNGSVLLGEAFARAFPEVRV